MSGDKLECFGGQKALEYVDLSANHGWVKQHTPNRDDSRKRRKDSQKAKEGDSSRNQAKLGLFGAPIQPESSSRQVWRHNMAVRIKLGQLPQPEMEKGAPRRAPNQQARQTLRSGELLSARRSGCSSGKQCKQQQRNDEAARKAGRRRNDDDRFRIHRDNNRATSEGSGRSHGQAEYEGSEFLHDKLQLVRQVLLVD